MAYTCRTGRQRRLRSASVPRPSGLAPVRFTAATLPAEVGDRFAAALTAGDHGSMDWLAREPQRRSSPDRLWPAARTAIVCGLNYGPADDPLPELALADRGYLSVYARHRDYHDVLKGRLKELAGWIAARLGCEVKVFVDTAPVLEKPLAQQAGLGWQGKHTNLVSREHGSWLFLGEILTDLAAAAGRARARPLRQLPPLPRGLPDRRVPRTLPARCAALHQLPDHRAQGPDPARAAPADGQPDLRLRRLPRRLPVEQVRASHPRDEAAGARGPGRTVAGRARHAWTMPVSGSASPAARSSASAATGSCATC